ncbi:hypothetical protein L1987_30531 [Smallanthus sonchifolius]|uniref:Uncharacterized protein n=1 Tax=Smallanthus sonchifolius TaxID=185202 RepID=A0ACB9I335_9ASTR|nr:hypothetical protein L1987_30531 [Smallanthus sonchifolius]
MMLLPHVLKNEKHATLNIMLGTMRIDNQKIVMMLLPHVLKNEKSITRDIMLLAKRITKYRKLDENIEDDPYNFVNDGMPRDHRVLDEVMPGNQKLGPLDNYRVTLNASVELDQRVYNRPKTSEV